MALETKSHLGRGVGLQGLLAGQGVLSSGWKRRSREVVSGSEADDPHLLAAASAREHLHVCGAPVGGDEAARVDVAAWLTWELRHAGSRGREVAGRADRSVRVLGGTPQGVLVENSSSLHGADL